MGCDRRQALRSMLNPAAWAEAVAPPPQIRQTPVGEATIHLDREICVAWRQTTCTTCIDICGEQAIWQERMLSPIIVDERCTYCGSCVKVCPSMAITLTRI